jgi:hypothetical protein
MAPKKNKDKKDKKDKKSKKEKKNVLGRAGMRKGVKSSDMTKLSRESRSKTSKSNSKHAREGKVRKGRGIIPTVLDIFIQGHGGSPNDADSDGYGHMAYVKPGDRNKTVRESLGQGWSPGTSTGIPDIHPENNPNAVPWWTTIRGMGESHIKSDTKDYESHFFNSATPMTNGYNGIGMTESANLMNTVSDLNHKGETTESGNHISKALNLSTTDTFKSQSRPYSSSKENIMVFLYEWDITPGTMLAGHWPGLYNMEFKPPTDDLEAIYHADKCQITEEVLNILQKKDEHYRGWTRCDNVSDRGWKFKDNSPMVVPLVRIEEALISLYGPSRINLYAHICQSRQDDLHYDTYQSTVPEAGRPLSFDQKRSLSRGVLDSSEVDVKYLADAVHAVSLGEFSHPPDRLSSKEMTETHRRENDQTIYNQSLKKLKSTSEVGEKKFGTRKMKSNPFAETDSSELYTIPDGDDDGDDDDDDDDDDDKPMRMEPASGGGKKRKKSRRRKRSRKRTIRKKSKKTKKSRKRMR